MNISVPASQVPDFYARHTVLAEYGLVADAFPTDSDGRGPKVPADFIDLNGNGTADWDYTDRGHTPGEPALSIPASSFMQAQARGAVIFSDPGMELVNYCRHTPRAAAYYHKGDSRVEISRVPVSQGLSAMLKGAHGELASRPGLQWALDSARQKFIVFADSVST